MTDRPAPGMAPTQFDVQPTGAAESSPWNADRQGQIAGRYRLLGLVATGGMGAVYRVHDQELDEVVALKVIRRDVVDQPGMLDRFRREVKLARRVTHPNVARTFDIGEFEGEKFITMELIDGESLAVRMARQRLSPAATVGIARELCAGLAAAHDAGVVHRDLKPDNILLSASGRVLITDFGIARTVMASATDTQGIVVGTPTYMAPEQVEGLPIDYRADLYALGAMLFEMVTGQQPWRGDSSIAVAALRLSNPPPNPQTLAPEVPAALAAIIVRLMQRYPDDRYVSTRAAAEALASLGELPSELHDASSSTSNTGSNLPPPPAPAPMDSGRVSHAETPVHRSLAVLPFENRGSPDDEYLVSGICEDLVDQLSTIRELRIRPMSMVRKYRGQAIDPSTVGKELGVQMLLEGSVVRRRVGDADSLRVSTRLIAVADGFQMWARRFDVNPSQVLDVSDELAAAVSSALVVSKAQPARGPEVNGAAIDLYLRARHHFNGFDLDNLQKLTSLSDEALALSPDDPSFVILAARAHLRAWFNGRSESADRARDLARRAVELAPNRAEPHAALASLELQRQNYPAAVRELRLARQLNPMLAEVHAMAGRLFAEVGPLSRAKHNLLTAFKLDPAESLVLMDASRVALLDGDQPEAERLLDQAMSLDQPLLWAVVARQIVWLKDRVRAQRVLNHPSVVGKQRVAEALMRGVLGLDQNREIGIVYSPIERRESASGRGKAFISQIMAESAALIATPEQSLIAIEASVSHGLIDLMWLERCPVLAPVRTMPRYAELVAVVRTRAESLRALLADL